MPAKGLRLLLEKNLFVYSLPTTFSAFLALGSLCVGVFKPGTSSQEKAFWETLAFNWKLSGLSYFGGEKTERIYYAVKMGT